MPIISNFPIGGGGSSGIALGAVTNITTVVSHEKAYLKWTDPNDIVVDGTVLAAFAGTLLVRKAGSAPLNRRDGTVVLDSKTRNAYKNSYFCESGLTDGVTYYYKFFSYTTQNVYTDSEDNLINLTPIAVAPANVSGMSVAAAGNGKVTLKWTDPNDTTQDGITTVAWGGSKVIYKKGSRPTSVNDGTLVLNSTTKNAYKTTGLTISGLDNGATYYFAVFPYGSDAYGGAVNTNASNVISGVPNRLKIANVPSQSGTLTYNGSAQTPSWNNYDSTKMTLSVTAQINAGSYTASFTPKDDYCWSDDSITAKTPPWTIGKAAGSLSLSKTSITFNSSKKSDSITVTRAGNGTITATSNNTSVATVSVSGTTVTVNSVNDTSGEAIITIKVAEGTNHFAPSDKTCSVSAEFIPALNDASWATISEVADAGQAANYWAVGDRKGVAVNGRIGTLSVNSTYYVYILGFAHHGATNTIDFGTFKTALTGGADICLCDSAYDNTSRDGSKYFNLNHWGGSSSPYNTNYGGWKGCDARYDVLGSTNRSPSGYGSTPTTSRVGYDAEAATTTSPVANTLMAALPADLRAVMKPMTIYTDNKGNSSNTQANVTTSVDYLPLLSEFEIFGKRTYANQYEQNQQEQYQYYKSGNSKVKNKHNGTSTAARWWERSPYYDGAGSFCIVGTNGDAYTGYSRSSYGLAPAFRV